MISGGTGDDIYKFDTDLALGSDILSDAGGIDTLDFSRNSYARDYSQSWIAGSPKS